MIETDKSNCMRAPAFGVAYVPKEAALCIGIDQINILATSKIVVENLGKTAFVSFSQDILSA